MISVTSVWRGSVCTAVALLCLISAPKGYADEAAYQLGVFPHLAAGQIEEMFGPVAADFGKALGRRVLLKTKPSFDEFSKELEKETYDIAFIQPFDYVWAHDKHGYIPLARRGEPLSGLIVVKPDSPLREIGDLTGKTVGLPPDTAAVSHLTKMALLAARIQPNKEVVLKHFKAHDSCLHQLLVGDIDACGTAAYPVRFFENKWNVKFRVLAVTQSIPHSLFVVHPRVSQAERERILKTVLDYSETEEGRKFLDKNKLNKFLPVGDSDYDVVRAYVKQIGG